MTSNQKKIDSVNHRVYLARLKSGKSQTQAAREAGMAQSALSAFESGDNKDSGKLLTLAMVYDVHPEWLLTGKGSIDLPFPFIALSARTLNYVQFRDINNYLEGKMENIEKITAYIPGSYSLGEKIFLTDMSDDSMQCDDSSSIPMGYKLIFDIEKAPEVGSIVLVESENRLVIKELALFGNGYILRSKNKNYNNMSPSFNNTNSLFTKILAVLVHAYKQF